jgi:L-ascorbate metabolism protein UlaG (beta-lactamase superfamily)
MNPPHHRENGFANLSYTPQLAEGYSMIKVMKDFFSRPKTVLPPAPLPSVKTDLRSYYSKSPSIVWFGHSSYLVHCNGLNILVDPVFSGHASPFSWYLKAFNGSDVYQPADMPPIDIMIITHNHYDHLDTTTIKALAPKTKRMFMPLGVSRYLNAEGINKQRITEMDWWQGVDIAPNIQLAATPARHFSGRGLKRNGSLWASFVLVIDGYKTFVGSDSGYDTHFREIGKQYGPFDIALLECGQYNQAWPFIHSMPEELVTEGNDLNAKVLMPVHWGKFALALHPWDEPVKRFVDAAEKAGIDYTIPMIGQPVVLDEYYPKEKWWTDDITT